MTTLGLISDTHGVFDPAAAAHLRSVDLVLHAGDVGHHGGHQEVLDSLAAATGAPVLAVAGNVDDRLDAASRQLLPTHRLVQCSSGHKLLLLHIASAGPHARVDAGAAPLIQQLQPEILVCGHSHKACTFTAAAGVVFINPGSAGPARFKLPRTCATLRLPPKGSDSNDGGGGGSGGSGGSDGGGMVLTFHKLPQKAPPKRLTGAKSGVTRK